LLGRIFVATLAVSLGRMFWRQRLIGSEVRDRWMDRRDRRREEAATLLAA